MHRNTFLLVCFLSVIAVILIGVNIGRRLAPAEQQQSGSGQTPVPSPPVLTYTDTFCNISLSYPSTYSVLQNASGSAVLSGASDSAKSIVVTCQPSIPRPAVSEDSIETVAVSAKNSASISALLYHDTSAKDGTPVDVLIFPIPGKNMDAYIAGYGDVYSSIIKTIRILP